MARANRIVTLEEVLKLAKQLSPVEKVRLIEQIAPEIEHDLISRRPIRSVSLLGIVKDLGPAPSAEEIDEARREAWRRSPGTSLRSCSGPRHAGNRTEPSSRST